MSDNFDLDVALFSEETDLIHYIGGFVLCKLEQTHFHATYSSLLNCFISSANPSLDTLLAAKSRGRLTNLTKDAESMCVSFEVKFRHLFPPAVEKVDSSLYAAECLKDEVVQKCFHSETDSDQKDQVLLDCIANFFKVGVHQNC